MNEPLIKVVELPPAEEAEYRRLETARREKQGEVWNLERIARDAAKSRNAARKQLKAIERQWLVLAEKKFPR